MRNFIGLISLYLIFPVQGFASPQAECESIVGNLNPSYQRYPALRATCDGIGHMEVSSDDRFHACETLNTLEPQMIADFSMCTLGVTAKNSCEADGGIWSYTRGSLSSGSCQVNCPASSSVTTVLTSDPPQYNCQCDDVPEKTFLAGTQDASFCRAENPGEDCGPEIDELDDAAGAAEYNACVARNDIEEQRRANEAEATAQATAQADAELAQKIAEAKAAAQAACSSAFNSFSSSCKNISAKEVPTPTDFKNAKSEAQCTHLKGSSDSMLSQSSSQVSSCSSQVRSVIASCPTSTASQSAEATVTVGSGAAAATVTIPRRSAGKVPENGARSSEAKSLHASLSNRSSALQSELAKVNKSSEECIAAFKEETVDPTAGKAGYAGGGSNYGKTKGGAYSGDSSFGELGKSGFATGKAIGNAAKNIYDKFAGEGGGVDLTKNGSNLGDPYGGPDDAVYGGTNNNAGTKAFTPNGGPTGNRNGTGKTTSASLIGGNSNAKLGANVGKKKRYKSAKARNLVNGFKSLKASDGGSNISIKPSDFKRYGSKALKAKLASARSKHGTDLPLIFKNGKFVLDFLAMKESTRFKAKTAAMESYMKGGQRKTASTADLPVHQDPRLNIFKIMNFRYQRQDFSDIREL